jgi:hypothetical protein
MYDQIINAVATRGNAAIKVLLKNPICTNMGPESAPPKPYPICPIATSRLIRVPRLDDVTSSVDKAWNGLIRIAIRIIDIKKTG